MVAQGEVSGHFVEQGPGAWSPLPQESTPVFQCIVADDEAGAGALFADNPDLLNEQLTLLYWAAEPGKAAAAERASVQVRQRTPLALAAQCGAVGVMSLLLRKGADVLAKASGQTALEVGRVLFAGAALTPQFAGRRGWRKAMQRSMGASGLASTLWSVARAGMQQPQHAHLPPHTCVGDSPAILFVLLACRTGSHGQQCAQQGSHSGAAQRGHDAPAATAAAAAAGPLRKLGSDRRSIRGCRAFRQSGPGGAAPQGALAAGVHRGSSQGSVLTSYSSLCDRQPRSHVPALSLADTCRPRRTLRAMPATQRASHTPHLS